MTPPDAHEAVPGGVLLGRYRLDRLDARGGMAAVWQASDERLGRFVAVKVLYEHLAADPAFLERFRREALSAARLHHPNIVQVFDSGKDAGLYFIVMEYLVGGNLRSVISKRRLSVQDSATVSVSAARALAYAHSRGLIHRDIKPGNILLSEDGHVKVGDFGIAKAQEHDELTGTKDVVGTAAYLSPEQLRGETPLPASDLYSLGVVLYEMLAGNRPFKSDGGIAAAASRLTEPPPRLESAADGLPAGLVEIVDRCLQIDADRRYTDAAHLAADLEPFAAGQTEVPALVDATLREGAAPSGGSPHGSRPRGAPPQNRPAPNGRSRTIVAPGPVSPHIRSGAPPPSRSLAPRPPGSAPQPPPRPLPAPPPTLAPKPRRRRFLRALVVLLVITILAAAGVVVGRRLVEEGRIPGIPGQGTPGAAVIAVRSFDPLGDGSENEPRARFVRDGDRGTAWTTERYGSADLGGLKAGVGILFRFDRRAACGSVTVHTTTPGWSGEVRVGDSASSSADAFRVAGSVENGSTDQRIGTGSASGEYWLLWFTLLPPGGGGYRLEVTEVEFGVCG